MALGIVTLALVSHLGPLPEPAKSLEMLQRHQAKRSEFGGELCQRDNARGRGVRFRLRCLDKLVALRLLLEVLEARSQQRGPCKHGAF